MNAIERLKTMHDLCFETASATIQEVIAENQQLKQVLMQSKHELEALKAKFEKDIEYCRKKTKELAKKEVENKILMAAQKEK